MTTSSTLPSWATHAAVARLATVDGRQPHLVPVVFCEHGGALFIPIDGKPKTGRTLRRIRNIEANPAVSLLIDEYRDDWSRLRWLRADGTATVAPLPPAVRTALLDKYPQYEATPMGSTAIRVEIDRIQSWSATGGA